MPQLQLSIFPASCTAITNELAFEPRDGTVYYFNGHLPVFSHKADDIAPFRFFTNQPIANDNASQGQISRACGVPLVTVNPTTGCCSDGTTQSRFSPHGGNRLGPPKSH